MKVNSHNEWDKLREIIVGTADGTIATLSWMRPDPIPQKVLKEATELAKNASQQWFYDEVSEDLQGLSDVLTGLGVKVLRPKPFDYSLPGSIKYCLGLIKHLKRTAPVLKTLLKMMI